MSIKRISIIVLSTLALIIFTGCSANDNNENNNHEIEIEGDHQEHASVRLTDEELKEFNIQLAKAGPGKLQIHVVLPGEVIIPPDNLAHIHPRFPGIVKKVQKHIGDRVKKGDILAVIESNESLSEYNIRSLIDGTLVEKHLSLGEVVDDSKHGFVIADLSTVWVYLKIYQKDLPYVAVGQKVEISAGPAMKKAIAKIDYISPIVDEDTRTTTARVVLNNRKGKWKPGLFVNGSIVTTDIKVDISVPKTAVETMNNNPVVFVRAEEGFEPREIVIGRTNSLNVEVLQGLNPGEEYVSSGGFTLKAELMKSEFGDGDEH